MRKHDKMKRLCMYLSIWTIVTDRVLQYCLKRLNRKPVFKLGQPIIYKTETDGPKVGSTSQFLWVFNGDGFRLPDSSLLYTYRAEMTTQWVNNPKSNKIKYIPQFIHFLNSVLCGKTRHEFFVFCYVIIKKTHFLPIERVLIYFTHEKSLQINFSGHDFSLSVYFFTGFSLI